MALSECNPGTDSTGRELARHGTTGFPIACYYDDFRKMDVPWHWHEELEAAVVTEGSCIVAAGNVKFTLCAGQGFFVNSGVLHGCWDTGNTGCRFHSLVFHSRLVGGSPDSIFSQRYLHPLTDRSAPEILILSPSVSWQKSALEAVESAWQIYVQEPAGFEFQVRDALSRLIFQLCSHLPITAQPVDSRQQRDADRIKTMLAFIHGHYAEDLNAKHIAASATISESECLRCFRSTIAATPIQYLRRYRIRQAAEKLAETDEKIADIAVRCGFQDMSYFTKTFRELMGCTPSEYRKKGANP